MFFKKRYIFGKKILVIQKIFEKKNLCKPKGKKKSYRKKNFFFIFYVKHVSIANMIRSLHIFELFSIIRRFKYSFIEKCIYLTMYLKGLY